VPTDSESATVIGHGRRGGPATSARSAARLGVLSRLRAACRSVFQAVQKVFDYIPASPQNVIHASVTEVAEAGSVSKTSVVRLRQHVGYSGFPYFKISLARDLLEPAKFTHAEVKPFDPMCRR
jgi:DNA-binding MurR/RpiR family transcriptional regulator